MRGRGRNCVSEAVSDTTIFSAFNNDTVLPLLLRESVTRTSHCKTRLFLLTISRLLKYNSPVIVVKGLFITFE